MKTTPRQSHIIKRVLCIVNQTSYFKVRFVLRVHVSHSECMHARDVRSPGVPFGLHALTQRACANYETLEFKLKI